MCGIIGFTGNLQAPGILVDGLQQLEYRGYDSAGIAVNNGSETKIVKTTGKVATLREKVEATADLAGTCGFVQIILPLFHDHSWFYSVYHVVRSCGKASAEYLDNFPPR